MKKQLSYFLARAQVPIQWVHRYENMEEDENMAELPEDVLAVLGNTKLSTHFRAFGKAVSVSEPKLPEDIYKTHLESSRTVHTADSARQNLAATFVNGFVNAGFGNDKLIIDAAEGQSWIYKNKEHGMMSATASIGMSMLWDSEAGIDVIDKYSYSAEEHIKAGAFLAMGILHSNIKSDPDVAFALLEDHVGEGSTQLRVAAINGIGIAYAGSRKVEVLNVLLPLVAEQEGVPMEVSAMAALALGFVFVGSGEGEVAEAILQKLLESSQEGLDSEWSIFLAVALGLLSLGKSGANVVREKGANGALSGLGDASEACIATLGAVEHSIAEFASTLVEATSFAGTGNVLKIQSLLAKCGEHAEKPKKAGASPTVESTETTAQAVGTDGDVDMEGAAAPTTTTTQEGTTSTTSATEGAATSTSTNTAETITPESIAAGAAGGESTEEDDGEAEPLKYQGAAVIALPLA
jgi:26S proteasome regulatory subunit N1